MDVLTSETCWALNNEMNNKASDIKLVSLYSTIKSDARSNKHNISLMLSSEQFQKSHSQTPTYFPN